jgi:excisionase family DNA binding protein
MKDWLTTQEVAEELGVTDTRVRQLILEGRLPAQKFGRANLIKRSDLKLIEGRKPGRPSTKKVASKKKR